MMPLPGKFHQLDFDILPVQKRGPRDHRRPKNARMPLLVALLAIAMLGSSAAIALSQDAATAPAPIAPTTTSVSAPPASDGTGINSTITQKAPPAQEQVVPPQQPPSPTSAASSTATAPSLSVTGNEPSAAHPSASSVPGIGSANLPRNLSPWKMFLSADIIVKAVMIGLAFASLLTWTIGFAKSIELFSARWSLRRTLRSISDAPSLTDASARLNRRPNALNALIDVARAELRLSASATAKEGIKERVLSRLDRITVATSRDMNRGTGLLATIGSTAPFVGLFGTVWGIMNSFIGISEAQTTNLAVVAPGIAEALLATALGLVAAIPAVFIYNQFARALASYKALVGDAAAEIMRLVSRDLDRDTFGRARISRAAE